MGTFTRKYKIVEKARNLFLRAFVRFIRRKHQKQIRYLSRKWKLEENIYDQGKLSAHMSLFGRLTKRTDSGWYKYFSSITGVEDERYLPPDIYYQFIEPVLNQVQFVNTLNDKNLYDKLYPNIKKPHVFVRYINGCFYDHHYTRISDAVIHNGCVSSGLIASLHGRLIIKPSVESGRGKQVARLKLQNEKLYDIHNKMITLRELGNRYHCDFLIQEEVKQHPSCECLSPGSLNTIRILTYRSVTDDAIVPLHIYQRIGKPGNVIDDFLRLGIEHDGRYKPYAIDYGANTYDNVNGLPIKSLGRFPFIEQIKEVAIEIAKENLHSRVIGLDLAVDASGDVVFLEANHLTIGIQNLQLSSGPMFGDYTEEVVNYCSRRARSFAFYASLNVNQERVE